MITLFGFILGAILGSFAKALADRSLNGSTFLGRSHCEKCKKDLSPRDLVPIFSFILAKGKCRYCGDKLSQEYLLVEVITGLLVGYLFSLQRAPGGEVFSFQLITQVFFITILVAVFLTDLKEMLIPDRIIVPAILISLTLLISLLVTSPQNFLTHLLTGLGIGGFFLALVLITRGKGMGGGDIKLGAFIGLVLGFPAGILAIVLSFLTGAVFSIFLLLFGQKKFGQAIPFGPFLVLGSLIALYWGNEIMDWYLKLGY